MASGQIGEGLKAESLRHLYDRDHARSYDDRFLLAEGWARDGTEFEVELIGELLERTSEPRWLDVACGTGFYLSRFDQVTRVGLDLSPAMLEVAARRDPGLDLVEGSFLDPHPEWRSRWSLVSCMWAAYSYVDSLDELGVLIENLSRWTSPAGSLFLPVCDVADLTGGMQMPYRNEETWVFGGELLIKAVIWEWDDQEIGKRHHDLIAPHVDHLIELIGVHFQRIELVHYPPYLPGWGSRRAIVASAPRGEGGGDGGPAVVVELAPPPSRNPHASAYEAAERQDPESGVESAKRLRALMLRLVRRLERWLDGRGHR